MNISLISTKTPKSSKPMNPRVKFFVSRIFPLIFVVIGAGVGFYGFRGLLRANASVDWPTTHGYVVRSSVEYHDSDEGDGTYHAEILYEFKIDGVAYNGKRIAYGDYGSSNPSHARAIVNRYPVKRLVVVYYMPENPEECLLEVGIQGQTWFLPLFGIVFFTFGSIALVGIPRALDKAEQVSGSNHE